MYGAILGDIIGSPYEFDQGNKTKEFPLFSKSSTFTDDSVMTIAVAEAFLKLLDIAEEETIQKELIKSIKQYGKLFPQAGYGSRYAMWLFLDGNKPYNSWGNGSAMRVSSTAWLFEDLDTVRKMARLSAGITHNHPEGIKGAEATAAAIFLARTGNSKAEIKAYIEENFGYDLSRTCDEIRPGYRHVESCQETVPEAMTAFLEGESFEDVVRTAVSLGGDCDTLTCIAGSIAEGFYGVPEELKQECRNRLPEGLRVVLERFDQVIGRSRQLMMVDPDRYYEEYLKGKSADQIRSRIRSLQRKIRQLQKEVDNPNSDGWMICPSPEVQLEIHRLYLLRARDALMDTIEYLEDNKQ